MPAEQDTDPRLATQGLVVLIPPPCESHGGGIQVDEPFWSSGVCAVRPSLRMQKFQITKTPIPTHFLRQQDPDALSQTARKRVMAERTTAEAKGRKE